MLTKAQEENAAQVAPLTGSVDRNMSHLPIFDCDRVAPLTGSVDRNVGALERRLGIPRRSPHGERG